MKKYLGIILLALSFQAQAAIVSLLENWNDFSDWTLGTQSNPVRFTSQLSVTSFGHDFSPTETDRLLRITGGFTSREPSLIYKQFSFGNGDILAFDWFTVYRDSLYDINGNMTGNDATYFLLSTDATNFLAYQLTDGLTLGGLAGNFTGWNTSYLQFTGSGDLYVGFAAIDYGIEGGAIFFGTDNLRLVDSIPTVPPSVGGSIDQVTRYDFGNGGQPPVATVPEPASAMLMLTGLLGIGYLRRRKSATSHAMHV